MKDGKQIKRIHDEKGSAIVIALFVLALISVFVAIAMSRSSAEAVATGNETAEARAFYAAQGSLEYMTRNFNKKFEVNLKPGTADFADVQTDKPPGIDVSKGGIYNVFPQDVIPPTVSGQPVILAGGPFAGLYAKRDAWRLQTTVTDP
ncbi:MAG: pilus assembly PilX N-terminal domain-containing protein, partial [Pyrinomonadaceae bacterium]